MNASEVRVYVFGRIRGLTRRSLESLSAAAGMMLTRRAAAAHVIVLGHSAASQAVSDAGELRLAFRPGPNAQLISERAFRSRLGLEPAVTIFGPYSETQVLMHSGLSGPQLRTLSLFDALGPVESGYAYTDLVAARAAGQLHAAGVRFPKIVAVALALRQRGENLSSVRLTESPWGDVLQIHEGALANIDGQLLLPFDGSDLDADAAFARAQACEENGELESARRWYELAARLDASDPVVAFNLGNVLVELGRTREAEIAYRRAIARSPDMADAWFNLGVLQENAGRSADALASYTRAFTNDPEYSDALHNAALLHIERREFGSALHLLERILANSPASSAEARRLAHLCRLEVNAAATPE